METLALFKAEDIFHYIPKTSKTKVRKSFVIDGKLFEVKLTSTRLVLFKQNPNCVCCGIKGSVLALQRHTNEAPHFNLFAIDENGEHLIMTKDHILPASMGGSDGLHNMQTMCIVCNNLKDNSYITVEQLQEVRAKYLELTKTIGHKKALHFINNMKKEMILPMGDLCMTKRTKRRQVMRTT